MRTLITFLILIVIVAGIGWYTDWFGGFLEPEQNVNKNTTQEEKTGDNMKQSTTTEPQVNLGETVIGQSAGGHNIIARHFGKGDDELLFVGGIHGGYSWNTSLVAFELVDYLDGNPDVIPENLKVTVIPVLNPDGLEKVTGTTTRFVAADVSEDTVPGRFNANDVDLNRNFDCNWSDEATWRQTKVDPGDSAFSEPESAALRDYIEDNPITAAIVWYSAAGGVYASKCNGDGVMAETSELEELFADASGYPAKGYFDAYAITGDAVDWMAKQGIPAVSVILSTHGKVEWDKNKAGIEAMLEEYGG